MRGGFLSAAPMARKLTLAARKVLSKRPDGLPNFGRRYMIFIDIFDIVADMRKILP
jgi:hypothetical protein